MLAAHFEVSMLAAIRPAIVLLALFTLLCGVAYPLVVTGVAQLVMPAQANGSLVRRATPAGRADAVGGVVVGSALIGQTFADPGHFWSRPSATSPAPYNASSSSGSNLGPRNPALAGAMQARVQALAGVDGTVPPGASPSSVPIDLVTASGSGLDPHISPAAAYWQVARVARARGADEGRVRALVDAHVEGRTLGILGEPRVNVLALNLALDDALPLRTAP